MLNKDLRALGICFQVATLEDRGDDRITALGVPGSLSQGSESVRTGLKLFGQGLGNRGQEIA